MFFGVHLRTHDVAWFFGSFASSDGGFLPSQIYFHAIPPIVEASAQVFGNYSIVELKLELEQYQNPHDMKGS